MNWSLTLYILATQCSIFALSLTLTYHLTKYRKRYRTSDTKNTFLFFFISVVFFLTISFCITLLSLLQATNNLPEKLESTITTESALLFLHLATALGQLFLLSGLQTLIQHSLPKKVAQISELEQRADELFDHKTALEHLLLKREEELSQQIELSESLENTLQSLRKNTLNQEKKIDALYDNSPTILITINKEQVIVAINHFGAQQLKTSEKSITGTPISTILAPESATKFDQILQEAALSREICGTQEIQLRTFENERFWVNLKNIPTPEASSVGDNLLICSDISESKKLEEILNFHNTHDQLTKLHNRSSLEHKLEEIVQRTIGSHLELAVLYIDVDQIKVVNDTCGHRAGDALLVQLVEFIKQSPINHPTPIYDHFARVGGDEFVMLNVDSSRETSLALAENIREITEKFIFSWDNQSFRMSVSIGVAFASDINHSITDLIGTAHAANYNAKENGRNRVHVHCDTLEANSNSHHEMRWVSKLQDALENQRFTLYFQPIIKIGTAASDYIHYEVLIRYTNSNGTLTPPNAFLPAAEKFGLASQIDLWVIANTLNFLNANPEHTKRLTCCSVNLTTHSIANKNTREAIINLASRSDFPTNKICFEITESSAIKNMNEASEFIQQLQALGCKIALDDFGTGFSCFAYLKNLSVDYIKIDGFFIRDIINDQLDRAVVTAINKLGQEMGIPTIAEYVENESILRKLVEIDIPYGQGYGLAKPMPLNHIGDFYWQDHKKSTIKSA